MRLLNITHLDVDVAPHGVQDVVAADGERVTIAGDDPDHQVRPGDLEAGGQRRRAAVDGVEAVGVHVVGRAARAADAADEDDVLARVAEVGHDPLRLGQDGVVAAARAPAHFLVGDEVLARELERLGAAVAGASVRRSSVTPPRRGAAARPSSTSGTGKGLPRTRLRPTASTR